MKNLNQHDAAQFLVNGILSQPFLDKQFIEEKLAIDYNNKLIKGIKTNKIKGLIDWIHHNIKYCNDKNFIINNQFKRTAKEIWDSGMATGCTDYALVFCTFARQLGIPTTLLHTAEYNWIKRLQTGEDYQMHYGHTFCECYFAGEWVLVDPTCKKITSPYNAERLELDYTIANSSIFIPYFRGMDLEKSQTLKQHNADMEEECRLLDI